jgi:hypothetical protein
VLDQRLITALRTVLSDESLDQAMVAEMLSLPGEAYLTEISEVADVEAIHAPASLPASNWPTTCSKRCGCVIRPTASCRSRRLVAEAEHFARRALQNIALSYLMLSGKPEVLAATLEQFDTSDNMTERLTALAVLVNSPFEAQKPRRWRVSPSTSRTTRWSWISGSACRPAAPCRAAGAGQGVDAAPGVQHQEPEQGAGAGRCVCRAEPDQLPRRTVRAIASWPTW